MGGARAVGGARKSDWGAIVMVLGVRLDPTGHPTALLSDTLVLADFLPIFSSVHQMSALWIRVVFVHCIRWWSVCLGQNTSLKTANLFSKPMVPEISEDRSTYPEGRV